MFSLATEQFKGEWEGQLWLHVPQGIIVKYFYTLLNKTWFFITQFYLIAC